MPFTSIRDSLTLFADQTSQGHLSSSEVLEGFRKFKAQHLRSSSEYISRCPAISVGDPESVALAQDRYSKFCARAPSQWLRKIQTALNSSRGRTKAGLIAAAKDLRFKNLELPRSDRVLLPPVSQAERSGFGETLTNFFEASFNCASSPAPAQKVKSPVKSSRVIPRTNPSSQIPVVREKPSIPPECLSKFETKPIVIPAQSLRRSSRTRKSTANSKYKDFVVSSL
jgi:hypothetical protein